MAADTALLDPENIQATPADTGEDSNPFLIAPTAIPPPGEPAPDSPDLLANSVLSVDLHAETTAVPPQEASPDIPTIESAAAQPLQTDSPAQEDPVSIETSSVDPGASVWRKCISALTSLLDTLATLIILADAPFSRLGSGIKNLLGGVGIATLTVAGATWVYGWLR